MKLVSACTGVFIQRRWTLIPFVIAAVIQRCQYKPTMSVRVDLTEVSSYVNFYPLWALRCKTSPAREELGCSILQQEPSSSRLLSVKPVDSWLSCAEGAKRTSYTHREKEREREEGASLNRCCWVLAAGCCCCYWMYWSVSPLLSIFSLSLSFPRFAYLLYCSCLVALQLSPSTHTSNISSPHQRRHTQHNTSTMTMLHIDR